MKRAMLSLCALALAGCGPGFQIASAPTSILKLDFKNLPDINPANGQYEAWVKAGNSTYTLGKFLVKNGQSTTLQGDAKSSWALKMDPKSITQVFVTQEPPGDKDDTPSKQVFLKGTWGNGQASLSASLPIDTLKTASGSYLLDDPATPEPTDYNGIWFARNANGHQVAGLTVPDAPEGTMYAAWVLLPNGKALRVGKFHHGMEDDDFAGYMPMMMPMAMPGEDFVTNLPPGVDSGLNKPALAGAMVVVSLEDATLKNEDQYPSPLRVLEGMVPQNPAQNQTYDLDNVVAMPPSGTATLK